jgi:hypothetical protein
MATEPTHRPPHVSSMDDTYWVVTVATILIVALILGAVCATRPRVRRTRRNF